MSGRKFYLDAGVGETRAVVTLGGRPERLLIARADELVVQGLGARVAARVRSVERAAGLAFLYLGGGPDAILNLAPDLGPIVEGGWIEIEIRTQARAGKGASARWLRAADGPARPLAPGPSLEARLSALAQGAPIQTGAVARAVADQAQDEIFETIYPLPGGGMIAVETTRALTAVDVDLGATAAQNGKGAARATNLAAIGEAARVLRLKGLGGLAVIDFVGRGHDGPALLAAARAAFAPDNPGIALGMISRFGTLEMTIPRRARPVLDILGEGSLGPSDATLAFCLLRALEREAAIDGGGRFEALAAPGIAAAATPFLDQLTNRFGARLSISSEAGRLGFEVRQK